MSLKARPITLIAALDFVRRLPKIQGGMWAASVVRGDVLIGVAVVGRPNARLLDDGRRLQVLRVAAVEGDASGSGHKGACSMLYGRARVGE